MAKKGRRAVPTGQIKAGGMNVYEDEKGRSIYYNRFNHSGYVLTDNEKPFSTYSMRFMIGIVAAVFGYMFKLPLVICILLGIAAYLVMEYKFRSFLKRLPQIPNYVPKRRQSKIDAETNQDMKKIILKCVLFAAFAVLIVINAHIEGYTGIMLFLNYALSIFAIVMFIVEIRAFFIKRKA